MRWPPSHNTAVAITTRPLLAVAAVVVVVAVMVELARVNLRQISKCSPPVTGLLPPPWKVFPLFLNINPYSLPNHLPISHPLHGRFVSSLGVGGTAGAVHYLLLPQIPGTSTAMGTQPSGHITTISLPYTYPYTYPYTQIHILARPFDSINTLSSCHPLTCSPIVVLFYNPPINQRTKPQPTTKPMLL